MSLSILSVAYPFAPIREDTAGGAEQVILSLDRLFTQAGHLSTVIAQTGSVIKGALIGIPSICGPIDDTAKKKTHEALREAIEKTLARQRFDIVHMHGIDFASYMPFADVPVLATLHLPLGWYEEGALRPIRPETHLNCVSVSQLKGADVCFPVVRNGVDTGSFGMAKTKGRYALSLGRVCPEKGFHIAMDAARRAGVHYALAGSVFRYEAHERYFMDEIVPRLGRDCVFLGPVGPERKRRLLSNARCVIVPSLAPETSSLAAMESLASGTPVVAMRTGALPEMIEDGKTGFLVDSLPEMAEAIKEAGRLSSGACVRAARERFDASTMAEGYIGLYREILEDAHGKAK